MIDILGLIPLSSHVALRKKGSGAWATHTVRNMRAAAGGPCGEKQFNAAIAGNPIRHVEASSSYAMIPLPLHLMYGTYLGLHAPNRGPVSLFLCWKLHVSDRFSRNSIMAVSSAERIDYNFHGEK